MLQLVEKRRTREQFVQKSQKVASHQTLLFAIVSVGQILVHYSLCERSVDLNQRVSKENAAAPLQEAACLLLARWPNDQAELKLEQGTLDRFCSSR
jgi:hypothetical protein